MNMNLGKAADQTLKRKDTGAGSPEKQEEALDEDDEVDFERDDDQEEVENQENLENIKDDDTDQGNKVQNHTIIKRAKNQVNVSVKIYTKNGKNKKRKGKKKKKQVEEPEKEIDPNALLDVLFAFIGLSSKSNPSEVLQTQYSMGMFEQQCHNSRQTAGTITRLPGATDTIRQFSETVSTRSSQRDFNQSSLK